MTVVDSKEEQMAFLSEQAPLYVEQKADSPVEVTPEVVVDEASVTLN